MRVHIWVSVFFCLFVLLSSSLSRVWIWPYGSLSIRILALWNEKQETVLAFLVCWCASFFGIEVLANLLKGLNSRLLLPSFGHKLCFFST